ncbi:MAG: hypothetical protein QUU85_16880 [Candidatus Eisenbacteria bacterium]|nr:hypothetical protein [Candidatus Eisenbacteria bacterium]
MTRGFRPHGEVIHGRIEEDTTRYQSGIEGAREEREPAGRARAVPDGSEGGQEDAPLSLIHI